MARNRESGSQSGGVNFGNRGNVKIGGDVVGGDKINTIYGDQVGGDKVSGDKFSGDKIMAGRDVISGTQTNTSGLTAEDVAKLFNVLYKQIESKPRDDPAAIKEAVDTIKEAAQAEAVEGVKPDEKAVTAAAKSLAVDAPDLLTDAADVVLATLANPAAGVITIIRKIAEKVKASRGE